MVIWFLLNVLPWITITIGLIAIVISIHTMRTAGAGT